MDTSATEVRAASLGKQPRNPISRRQVEAVISRSVAVFGLVFGAQTVPALLSQLDDAVPVWLYFMVPAVFGSLIFALVASIVRRGVRASHTAVAFIYLVALISWPFAVQDHSTVTAGNHWLYFLLTVATACASIGLPTRSATAYLFVVPAIYGLIRTTPAGGAAIPAQAILDSIYAVILGGAVMMLDMLSIVLTQA